MATTIAKAKATLVAFGLTAALGLSLGLTAQGQEKDKKGDKKELAPIKPVQADAADGKAEELPPYRLRNIVRLGYTRPANEPDVRKDGKIVPLAFTDYQGKIVGGTVYFMVLERERDRDRDRDRDGNRDGNRDAVDQWGTGLGDFDTRFIPGRNFDGGVSPQLDRRAKYIYLYQVVNDRGLDPGDGVGFAAFDKVRAQDVASFGLKLLVDPRYITSWGHFQGSSFTALAKDRNQINQVRLAADGKEEKIRLAVSSNPSILADLPQHQYRFRSPAYSLGTLGRSFDVGTDTLNLAKSFNYQYLDKNQAVVGAAFVKNELKAAVDGGKEPAFVQIMYFTGNEGFAANPAGLGIGMGNLAGVNAAPVGLDDTTAARGIFRVDWRGGNFVKLGQESVLFGFTTDLPPVDEPIGIADPDAALSGNGIRQVVSDPNITPAAAPGVAPGTAPTPSGGGSTGGGTLTPGGTFGTLGGIGGGGGNTGGLGFPGGAIGTAPAPILGGGGGTGSTGTNTTPATTGTTQGQQAGQQAGTTVNVNVNSTLDNQQAQQQQQNQAQGQGQNQNQNQHQHQGQGHGHGHTGNVVPAPASLLLGLLGVPGWYILRRRPR